MQINSDTFEVELVRGDTDTLTVTAETETEFGSSDRAMLAVMTKTGADVLIKVSSISDNKAVFSFTHDETKDLPPNVYLYSITYYLNAVLDDSGIPTGGNVVNTPVTMKEFRVIDRGGAGY